MKIKNVHREIAKLLWEGDLTIEEIATLKKVSDRAIYRWKNDPDFDALFKITEEGYKTAAKREAIRRGKRSVQTLLKLQDFATEKDQGGNVIREEFKFGADVARKAAVDLLEIAEVKIKLEEGHGASNTPIFIIQTNGNQSKATDKPQEFSKRFRPE